MYIGKKYTNECKKLTKELDTSIDDLKTQLRTLELIKDKLVDDNNLGNIVPPKYGCEIRKEHPVLKKFDIETDKKIQDIIRDE